jgi:hypothetical protein
MTNLELQMGQLAGQMTMSVQLWWLLVDRKLVQNLLLQRLEQSDQTLVKKK